MGQRSTADLIALILTIVVAVVVLATTIGILVIQLVQPSEDSVAAADSIGRIINVLVGALIGYIAGRRSVNGNGKENGHG